jgi:pimeloyl-ACP methyl ester carboxylesterase
MPREVEMLSASPSWPSRLAAAPTIARELRALEKYDVLQDQRKQFRTPTLLLVGSHSSPHVRNGMESLGKTLAGSSLATLDGHGHFAMDTGPESFVQRVTQFLDSVE